MTTPARPVIVAELAAMTTLLLSYIWLWQGTFRGDFLVVVLLYFAIGISAHLRRGETPAEIGLGFAGFVRALLPVMLCVGPLIVLVVVIGARLGSLDFGGPERWLPGLGVGFVWGTMQQYGLLAFYCRRFRELLGGWPAATFAAATTFAMCHLPNPFLVAVTWFTGLAAGWLYRRTNSIWAIGVAHGLLAGAISGGLPDSVTFGMRVGPGMWSFLERARGVGVLIELPWA